MPGRFLIDMTDARFRIAANAEVMEFVRRVNPFAHSDPGIVLLELGDELTGVHAYSPSFRGCAYVVLHTEDDVIFAIAYGQKGLALRLPAAEVPAALADGGAAAPQIGPCWVAFPPYDAHGQEGARARLRRWCACAFADAPATGDEPR